MNKHFQKQIDGMTEDTCTLYFLLNKVTTEMSVDDVNAINISIEKIAHTKETPIVFDGLEFLRMSQPDGSIPVFRPIQLNTIKQQENR